MSTPFFKTRQEAQQAARHAKAVGKKYGWKSAKGDYDVVRVRVKAEQGYLQARETGYYYTFKAIKREHKLR